MTVDQIIILVGAMLGSGTVGAVVMHFIDNNDILKFLHKDRIKQYSEHLISKGEVSREDYDHLITMYEKYTKRKKNRNGVLANRIAEVKEIYDASKRRM